MIINKNEMYNCISDFTIATLVPKETPLYSIARKNFEKKRFFIK